MLPILSSRDFYNTNGCRDLLFNTQESCLTIPQIQDLLADNDLVFVGFHSFAGGVLQNFRNMFPLDSSLYDLAHWQQFELQHPNCFAQMYRFHCQKPI